MHVKSHKISDLQQDVIIKMVVTGICYGIGLLCYLEAVKYQKPSLNNMQTVLIFIMSSILGYIMTLEKSNKCKNAGILTIVFGLGLLVYGHK